MRIPTASAFASAFILACSAVKTEIDPRFVAVHNTLTAMGLAQIGPMQQGALREGQEARLRVDLPAQCTTVVVMGGAGVRDIDLAVIDPSGKPVGHDTTSAPQAAVRACSDAPGTFTLAIKMAAGDGDFVTGLWSGSVGAGGSATASEVGDGTCEAPHMLAVGLITDSNAKGTEDSEGEDDCGGTRGKEVVYRLDLQGRKRVILDVESRFGTVVYIRRDGCEDGEQVACNDDLQSSTARVPPSHIDAVLEQGTYWVFVDTTGDTGSFRMTTQLLDVPTLADACRNARSLTLGAPTGGTTHGSFNHARASCADEAKGRDAIYRLDIGQRSRVRVTHHSDDFTPVVHVRRMCVDEQTEIACSDSAGVDSEAATTAVLDPGQYYVFADSYDEEGDGRFTLEAEVAPEQGSGVSGESCADATPLTKNDPDVSGDTFDAKDDVAVKCGGAGAPDTVYRVDVARRSHVTARMRLQDSEHVFALVKSCGDRTSEIACSKDSIEQTLEAGTYFLVVDGATPSSFGRYAFDFRIKDIAALETACKSPPELKANTTVTGTTQNAGDRFFSGCAGSESAATSSDRVYKISVAKRTLARLTLSSPTFDSVLSLRRTCLLPQGSFSGSAGEITCQRSRNDSSSRTAHMEMVLEPGTHFLVVDGMGSGNEGPFTLEYKASEVP